LLQVSLASGSTLDPDAQAQNALGELTKVLGAERAMFFMLTENGELLLKASTGSGTEKISQSIVRKVIESRAPVVLTGNEEGEALGSGSIVAFGLRSIMAAPLMVRERLIGVVYLDSRLAKGMFSQDDVSLLQGISNHIAIAVDTARTARLEAERASLARDLEILGVVQNLLLPKSPTFEAPSLKGAGFYQAAAQCGGDWWWHRTRADGSTILVVGDVSGHGAGPAMLTSAVSGTFQVLCDLFPDASPPEILKHLHTRVKTFSGYHMTMSMAVVDPVARTLSWWNAGGPEIYLLSQGKMKVLNVAGTTLGTSSEFTTGSVVVPISVGDRLLMCTDGVLELRRNGRMLGNKQTAKMFTSYSKLPIVEACTTFGADLNSMLVGQEQEDDITFLLLEITE
jgi:serine phosphatase RsbU (regulator of sigma subunit)